MPQATDYTQLITSEHSTRPNFVATLTALVQPMVDLQNQFLKFPALFDLDQAVGDQLDKVGTWVGQSRNIAVPLTGVFFSWGITGLGWGQGVWFGPGSQATGLTSLPDDQYRTLLRAVIAGNQWDGTVPGIYSIWAIVFSIEQFQILVVDNLNMSMTILLIFTGHLDALRLALITNGLIVPRPAGVLITGYTQLQAPIFGWGLETPLVQGWGQGNWV